MKSDTKSVLSNNNVYEWITTNPHSVEVDLNNGEYKKTYKSLKKII